MGTQNPAAKSVWRALAFLRYSLVLKADIITIDETDIPHKETPLSVRKTLHCIDFGEIRKTEANQTIPTQQGLLVCLGNHKY